jgi:glycosyltransferase involved in cell wall biosynthesis
VHFVCIGHGDASYLKGLQELTRTLGIENRVKWVNARPDVRGVYKALDIFCSASSSEGFPNVIGGAMACGLHCAVTDVGDSKLVVGNTGVAVPSNDVEGLAAGLRQELGRSGLNLRARQRKCNRGLGTRSAHLERSTLAARTLTLSHKLYGTGGIFSLRQQPQRKITLFYIARHRMMMYHRISWSIDASRQLCFCP